jgi:hypothetical protein
VPFHVGGFISVVVKVDGLIFGLKWIPFPVTIAAVLSSGILVAIFSISLPSPPAKGQGAIEVNTSICPSAACK